MRVHDGGSQRGLAAVVSAQEREHTPAQKHGEKKRGGHREPAPRRRIPNRHDGSPSCSAKLCLQLLAQRLRRTLVQASALKRRAQILVNLESGDAIGAGNQVALEIGGSRGGQLAIEIAVEN